MLIVGNEIDEVIRLIIDKTFTDGLLRISINRHEHYSLRDIHDIIAQSITNDANKLAKV